MTVHESLHVDAYPIDDELRDDGTAGPELAWLARSYCDSPRALVFRNPSPDWRLFVVTLPLASRLSLMANPVFAQLTRAWGMNVRFVGVDRDGLVHDFRALLTDRTLALLVELLARRESGEAAGGPGADPGSRGDRALDLLFDALAREMLTVLERRHDDWPKHLARDLRLESGLAGNLFDHAGRHPDFLAGLRGALRKGLVDVEFYGRALRSIDLREAAVDARIAAMIESALDPATLAKLARTGAGRHLGCYNWLRIEPARAASRAYILARLPSFANFFAEALLAPEAPGADFDLRPLAARSLSAHSLHWAGMLRRAVDAGQDRAAIEAIAQRFAVGDNVIRRIWREQPAALGQPPTWHLAQILRRLHALGERDWPATDAAWRALISHAVPAEAL
ncbi:hypothetical protein M6I34_11880 [Burkholderiaceae bacterium FT117]|uniref:hypothetical protein n=1 Tax=Zeimonas sediminis TaxID=2944268 RepID=UPI002342E2B4|nr:hypothetical protein [Zeimonas sediminis]MCM5571206.1 hypothetical protein [Zeimonas sediminis]